MVAPQAVQGPQHSCAAGQRLTHPAPQGACLVPLCAAPGLRVSCRRWHGCLGGLEGALGSLDVVGGRVQRAGKVHQGVWITCLWRRAGSAWYSSRGVCEHAVMLPGHQAMATAYGSKWIFTSKQACQSAGDAKATSTPLIKTPQRSWDAI
jgi:hypothetical protein